MLGGGAPNSYNTPMPTVPSFHVDAFATKPFAGNPAAVCLLDAPRPAKWMQRVAAEFALSETAFVTPKRRGFGLRWFTPACEVDLCGHATLATAHVLWSEGIAPSDAELSFATRSGTLVAAREGERIRLDFPAAELMPVKASAGFAKVLGAKALVLATGGGDLLVEVADEATVRTLVPDLAAIARWPFRGVVVTAKAARARTDFVSRFFGPAVGVPEDPVTGSAHCALAPYWADKLGKTTLRAHQASARGGDLECRLVADRVHLLGSAVTVVRSELLV